MTSADCSQVRMQSSQSIPCVHVFHRLRCSAEWTDHKRYTPVIRAQAHVRTRTRDGERWWERTWQMRWFFRTHHLFCLAVPLRHGDCLASSFVSYLHVFSFLSHDILAPCDEQVRQHHARFWRGRQSLAIVAAPSTRPSWS